MARKLMLLLILGILLVASCTPAATPTLPPAATPATASTRPVAPTPADPGVLAAPLSGEEMLSLVPALAEREGRFAALIEGLQVGVACQDMLCQTFIEDPCAGIDLPACPGECPPDNFPAFWAQMDRALTSGLAVVPEAVLDELDKKSKETATMPRESVFLASDPTVEGLCKLLHNGLPIFSSSCLHRSLWRVPRLFP